MTRVLTLTTVLLLAGIGFAADPPKVSDLVMEDQFEKAEAAFQAIGTVVDSDVDEDEDEQ